MPKKLDQGPGHEAIEFTQQFLDVRAWVSKAEELSDAADLLSVEVQKWWEECETDNEGAVVLGSTRPYVQPQYFMLIAYAMENYFKAILVHDLRKRHPNRLWKSVPIVLKDHDLKKLAKRVSLSLAPAEQELLTRLHEQSVWRARYPAPVEWSGLRATNQIDGNTHLTAYLGPHDTDRIHSLMDRLRGLVASEIGDAS